MKKMFQLGAMLCCLFLGQYGYAQDMRGPDAGNFRPDAGNFRPDSYARYNARNELRQGEIAAETVNGCPEDRAVADQPVGDCWCLYCHYEPCYYNCWRCVEDQKHCKKKCCRYVPQYYEVQHCRYVPKYETETKCRYVPENYYVDECIPCKRWVCDRKCKYVPRYYYKHTSCGENACEAPCPSPCQ